MNSTKSETGELDTAEEEVVTQSDENVLLQKFTARVMDMLRTMVKWCNWEPEWEWEWYNKTAKAITKKPQNDPIPSPRSADAFGMKQGAKKVNKAMCIVILNDIVLSRIISKLVWLLFAKEWG